MFLHTHIISYALKYTNMYSVGLGIPGKGSVMETWGMLVRDEIRMISANERHEHLKIGLSLDNMVDLKESKY